MDIKDFVELADEYAMGAAITSQLKAVIENGRDTDPTLINSNALDGYILPFLERAESFGIDVGNTMDDVRYLLEGDEDEDER